MLLTLLAACPSTGPSTGSDTDTPAPVDEGGPTYYADVAPVVDRVCARCHVDGGVAPVSFSDPGNVVALSGLIAQYTRDGYMPPPAPDPACADYVDSERMWLSDAEKQLFSDWNDAGAPLGDPADAPAPWESWTTAPFDRELFGAEPYTPTFGIEENDYWCWPVELALDGTAFITGTEALVDFVPEVHHIVLFRDWSDVEHDEAGFTCSGLGAEGWEYITGWGPGATAMQFPEGMGLRVEPTERWVLQVHYFEGSSVGPDNTGLGLHLADTVEHEVRVDAHGVYGFNIPAGEADHTETERVRGFGTGYHILSIWPHMHVLGSGFEMFARREDDTETCIVDQSGWDFHSQATIQLREEVVLTGDDTLVVRCHWDNSAENPDQPDDPPEDVHFGEGTGDEMCFGFTYAWVE